MKLQPIRYKSGLHSNTCGNMLSQEYVANHIKSSGGVKPRTLCKNFENGLACAVWTDKGRDGLAPADGMTVEQVMQLTERTGGNNALCRAFQRLSSREASRKYASGSAQP